MRVGSQLQPERHRYNPGLAPLGGVQAARPVHWPAVPPQASLLVPGLPARPSTQHRRWDLQRLLGEHTPWLGQARPASDNSSSTWLPPPHPPNQKLFQQLLGAGVVTDTC